MSGAPITRRTALAVFTAAGLVGAGAVPAAAVTTSAAGGARSRQEYQKRVAVRLQKALWQYGDTSLVDRFVSPTYIQHNPLAPDGPAALKAIAVAVHQQFPDETFDIIRVFAEGDLVVMHSHSVFVPGTAGRDVVDIVRFQDGLIAEHWDIIQNVPSTSASGHDLFSTLSTPRTNQPGPQRLTECSEDLVTAYVRGLAGRDISAVDEYLAHDVIQHDPAIIDGAQAAKAAYAAYFQQYPDFTYEVKRTIAEGDLVAVHAHLIDTPGDLGQAVADLFRVRDGRIVEHWDVFQDVPATSQNGNTMF